MEDVMGVINLINDGGELNELTRHRSSASVPFGGKYRLIDFSLSNMVNSGIKDVSIFTLNKYRSLMDHLGTGYEWDLDRKRGGLFILPPSFEENSLQNAGDLLHFQDNIDFFYRGEQNYVLITGGNLIANIDFRPAFEFHKSSGADVTVIYKRLNELDDDISSYFQIAIRENNRVYQMGRGIELAKSVYGSLDIYIMKKQLLLEMMQISTEIGQNDFKQCVIGNLGRLKVNGFEFNGYATKINSIATYFNQSMKLLSNNNPLNLFHNPAPIYTKVKDEPPAKYLESAEVTNSIIANGCMIEGKIENSILFRGVKVKKGVTIRNSIIMQKSNIEENTLIENSILDKEVYVSQGSKIIGKEHEPMVIMKKSMI